MRMPVVPLLLLAVIAVLPAAAQATPLTITTGGLTYSPFTRGAAFLGDDFGVLMSETSGISTVDAFGVDTFILSQSFNGAAGFANVFVGAALCSGPPDDCGTITLTSRGLPPLPTNWPMNTPFIARVPFTATGHLNVGGGFDIVGRGVLTGIHCFTRDDFASCPSETPRLIYGFQSFTVAEPPTALLPIAGVMVLVAMIAVHRRRRPIGSNE
jgi:hypothetical protein